MTTHGSRATELTRLAKRNLTPGASTICTGMSGSGALTGSELTTALRRPIRSDRLRERRACGGAELFATSPGIAGPQAPSVSALMIAATTLVCAWLWWDAEVTLMPFERIRRYRLASVTDSRLQQTGESLPGLTDPLPSPICYPAYCQKRPFGRIMAYREE